MPIVRAEQEHLPDLFRLYTAVMRAMRAAGIEQWGEDYPNEAVIRGDVEAGSLHVLEEDGALVAAICLNETQAPEYRALRWHNAEPVLVVHRLCVTPARWRGGIASRLMDFAEERARRNGYAAIRLDTYSGNPMALALYERRGYRRTGEVRFRGRTLSFFCFEKILAAQP